MPEPRSWTFEIPGRPLTLNSERKGSRHWTQNRAEVAQARKDAAQYAQAAKIPRGLTRIAVIVRPLYRDRRTSDVGAVFPAAKAAIDGLVDARVIADDGPAIVVQLTFDAPATSTGRDALEVTVEEIR